MYNNNKNNQLNQEITILTASFCLSDGFSIYYKNHLKKFAKDNPDVIKILDVSLLKLKKLADNLDGTSSNELMYKASYALNKIDKKSKKNQFMLIKTNIDAPEGPILLELAQKRTKTQKFNVLVNNKDIINDLKTHVLPMKSSSSYDAKLWGITRDGTLFFHK